MSGRVFDAERDRLRLWAMLLLPPAPPAPRDPRIWPATGNPFAEAP